MPAKECYDHRTCRNADLVEELETEVADLKSKNDTLRDAKRDLEKKLEQCRQEIFHLKDIAKTHWEKTMEWVETKKCLEEKISRLITAAAGRGMVSEMDNMQEVAVLVCGLHDKVAALRAENERLREAIKSLDREFTGQEAIQLTKGQQKAIYQARAAIAKAKGGVG